MNVLPEARDYLAAEAIVRGLLRIFSPARIVVDEQCWTIWAATTAGGQEASIVSGRDLAELAHNVEKLLTGREEPKV